MNFKQRLSACKKRYKSSGPLVLSFKLSRPEWHEAHSNFLNRLTLCTPIAICRLFTKVWHVYVKNVLHLLCKQGVHSILRKCFVSKNYISQLNVINSEALKNKLFSSKWLYFGLTETKQNEIVFSVLSLFVLNSTYILAQLNY